MQNSQWLNTRLISHSQHSSIWDLGPLDQLLLKSGEPGYFYLVATQCGACDFQGQGRIAKED